MFQLEASGVSGLHLSALSDRDPRQRECVWKVVLLSLMRHLAFSPFKVKSNTVVTDLKLVLCIVSEMKRVISVVAEEDGGKLMGTSELKKSMETFPT